MAEEAEVGAAGPGEAGQEVREAEGAQEQEAGRPVAFSDFFKDMTYSNAHRVQYCPLDDTIRITFGNYDPDDEKFVDEETGGIVVAPVAKIVMGRMPFAALFADVHECARRLFFPSQEAK